MWRRVGVWEVWSVDALKFRVQSWDPKGPSTPTRGASAPNTVI